jgi:hypothetical protein
MARRGRQNLAAAGTVVPLRAVSKRCGEPTRMGNARNCIEWLADAPIRHFPASRTAIQLIQSTTAQVFKEEFIAITHRDTRRGS